MNVLAYDPFAPPQKDVSVERMAFDELLSRSDIVTLHVPLTPATEKMINARSLEMMKANALLVNTSRGRVVDEPILFEALKAGRIGGAALDVFAGEPISGNHPFTQLENVVLSPHIGAMTQEAGERLSDAVARQARDILGGRRPECLVTG
jgi:phosphoglycerate dehydrogenase-like enzyme